MKRLDQLCSPVFFCEDTFCVFTTPQTVVVFLKYLAFYDYNLREDFDDNATPVYLLSANLELGCLYSTNRKKHVQKI